MATLTASAFAQSPRAVHTGDISVSGSFNSGSTSIDASATTILLCKIPNKATILDLTEHHSSGAATCPVDIGIDSTLSAFVSQATTGSITRATVGANIPYTVSLSDDAAANYSILKATYTPGSATTSLKVKFRVTYTMDA